MRDLMAKLVFGVIAFLFPSTWGIVVWLALEHRAPLFLIFGILITAGLCVAVEQCDRWRNLPRWFPSPRLPGGSGPPDGGIPRQPPCGAAFICATRAWRSRSFELRPGSVQAVV